jgi:hypothetical protein
MSDENVSKALERRYKVGVEKPTKDEDYSIDFSYWLKFDVWNLKQAASILENSEPRKLSMRLIYDETFSKNFQDTLQLIVAAEGRSLAVVVASERYGEDKIKHGELEPKIFVQWASEIGLDIPEPLIHLLGKKVAAGTARSSNADAASLKHAPRLLNIAFESWRRIWMDKEIHNAPKQKMIVPWIQETFNTSEREAKLIDQIIRPDEKKKGAVKKRLLRG